jgi:branched-chain amino acid aminotransferase
MLGPDGRVSEGTGENLFLVRDGMLLSPPPSEAGALRGITQSSIVKIANDLGYDVAFEALRRDDIYLADEAFVTGTAVEVVPLSSVDDRLIGDGKPGPITKAIISTYHQAVRGERPQYEDWLARV